MVKVTLHLDRYSHKVLMQLLVDGVISEAELDAELAERGYDEWRRARMICATQIQALTQHRS